MIVYGINPVLEALRAGRVRRLRVARSDRRIDEALTLARELRVPVERVDVQAAWPRGSWRRASGDCRRSGPTP